MFHSQSNSFSMFFSNESDTYYPYGGSPPSSSVDCTLSLGTPSTRLSEDDERQAPRHDRQRRSLSNFCWGRSSSQSQKSGRGGGSSSASGNDSLLARRCANCDTTSTPLWRNGPRGPKSLCNACGIRFKKEERRANAANANTNQGAAMGGMDMSHQNNWYYQHSQSQRMAYFSPGIGNEFQFIEDGNGDSDSGIPFLSWRLNVPVHDYTR